MRRHVIYIGTLISFLICCSGCDQRYDRTFVTEADATPEPLLVAPPRKAPDFSTDVAPLFDQFCMRCHDDAAASGGVVLNFGAAHSTKPNRHVLLTRVADNLRTGTMPPPGEPRPDADDLETINSWLDAALSVDDRPQTRVTIRRLNRAEYNNTVRDLIGLDLRPAQEFPSDDVGYGFDNVGEVLSTPPVLLEMYLAAAEKVIAEACRTPDVRARLLNPPMDTVPRAFRQYTPPVRSSRDDKTLRAAPTAPDQELQRQQNIYNILLAFSDRAFRRPATHEEVTRLLGIVLSAEKDGESFETALQLALRAVLVSPHFLFLEPTRGRGSVSLSDFDLAARLSYFLWSSMPDEELFRVAAQGSLRRPEIVRAQLKRMLRNRNARALAENFGSQWLQTRKLDTFSPDPALFPEFDDALKDSMRRETELFFEWIRDKDRSVLEFLDADHMFVNERLARHYGLKGIHGEHFRRVSVVGTTRGGVLTQASVLASTSNPNRTSPVKRGKWVLENILGAPPSPPPSGVEALKEGRDHGSSSTLRQRMERHRTDPACAGCHRRMDPLGFGLENFDAVGAYRDVDGGLPIDSSGQLPDGRHFSGPNELKAALALHQDAFTRCLTEKMLTYALGRGLDRADRRAVDQIVASLRANEYRFSALVLGVVESEPFLNPQDLRGKR